MTNVQYTLHIVNFLLFGIALYIHARGYVEVRECRAAMVVKRLGKNVMIAGASVSSLFLLLQADWVINQYNEAVGDSTSWAWLLFDYALSVYLLVMGTLVRVFVKWRGNFSNAGQRRRYGDAQKTL